MISWSDKNELDISRSRISNAESGELALQYLVKYIEFIRAVSEVNRLIVTGLRELTGAYSNVTREVYRFVGSGKNESDKTLMELVGGSSDFGQEMRLKKVSSIVAGQLHLLFSSIETESQIRTLIFDKKKSCIYSSDNPERSISFAERKGQPAKRMLILTKLKSEKSMTTQRLSEHTSIDPDILRREIIEINKRFKKEMFDAELITVKGKKDRQNIYILSTDFTYR